METNSTPYEMAAAHLLAARALLSEPAAQARALKDSPSPRARTEAQEMTRHIERLRSRITGTINAVNVLEAVAHRAQSWHDRYEAVNGR